MKGKSYITGLLLLLILVSGCYTRIFPPVDDRSLEESQPILTDEYNSDVRLSISGYSHYIFPMSPDFYYRNYLYNYPFSYYDPFQNPFDYSYYDPYYFSSPYGYYGYPGNPYYYGYGVPFGYYGYYNPYSYSYNFFGGSQYGSQPTPDKTSEDSGNRSSRKEGRTLPDRTRTPRTPPETENSGIFFPGHLPLINPSTTNIGVDENSNRENERETPESKVRRDRDILPIIEKKKQKSLEAGSRSNVKSSQSGSGFNKKKRKSNETRIVPKIRTSSELPPKKSTGKKKKED